MLDLENYSLDYVFETDAQTEFLLSECTKSENGYYAWGRSWINKNLCFIDSQTLKAEPLCTLSDCMHVDSTCNAYFNNSIKDNGEFYDHHYIQYYDGYIYIVGMDHEYENLYRVSLDGSTCDKYMSLYKVDLSPKGDYGDMDTTNVLSYMSPDVWIHRGYVYYIDNKATYPKICRMKLGGNVSEVVYETGGESPMLYRMLPYGDYLFFQTGNFINASGTDIEGGIMAYNINTGKTILVKKGAVSTYGIKNNTLYYYNSLNEIVSVDLENGEKKTVCHLDMALNDGVFSEKYIYSFNYEEGTLCIYDYDGKLLGSVYDKNIVMCWFGDDKYILADCPSYGEAGIAIISVDDIIAG